MFFLYLTFPFLLPQHSRFRQLLYIYKNYYFFFYLIYPMWVLRKNRTYLYNITRTLHQSTNLLFSPSSIQQRQSIIKMAKTQQSLNQYFGIKTSATACKKVLPPNLPKSVKLKRMNLSNRNNERQNIANVT